MPVADITVGRTDDTVGEFDLFHAVGTPAADSGNGKDRGVQHLINPEHAVDQTGKQVDIGTGIAGMSFFFFEDFRGKLFDHAQQIIFFLMAGYGGQMRTVVLENLGPWIGLGIDRMADAVNEA